MTTAGAVRAAGAALPLPETRRFEAAGLSAPIFQGAFWTARQRQASSLHEVSYRACFKPQLPAFFIDRYSRPGDVVFDPFLGRGTTAVEAALRGRVPAGNDANPLSAVLARPRVQIPMPADIIRRIESLPFVRRRKAGRDLSMFYHPDTLSEIVSLRDYLNGRRAAGKEDGTDRWIRMVATNRLTGHSAGFISVYTLPPNQAASSASQVRINARLRQAPEYRDVRKLLLKKTRQLLKDVTEEVRARVNAAGRRARFLTGDAAALAGLPDASIDLTVTSPPFLDVVQYEGDNWLRNWFNDLSPAAGALKLARVRTVEDWSRAVAGVFRQALPGDQARRTGGLRGGRGAPGQRQAGGVRRARGPVGRVRAGGPLHPPAALHQDRPPLGRVQQRWRHQQPAHFAVPKTGRFPMKRILMASMLLLATGCKQNAATTYTGALKDDTVTKAHAAAQKANDAVSDENGRTDEAQKATE